MTKYYNDDQIQTMLQKAEQKAQHQTTIQRYQNVYHLSFEQAKNHQKGIAVSDEQTLIPLSISQLAILNEAESQLKIDSDDDLNFNEHYRQVMDHLNAQIKQQDFDD